MVVTVLNEKDGVRVGEEAVVVVVVVVVEVTLEPHRIMHQGF